MDANQHRDGHGSSQPSVVDSSSFAPAKPSASELSTRRPPAVLAAATLTTRFFTNAPPAYPRLYP
jgi:hypothetical protein